MEHKELEHFMRHETFVFMDEGYIFSQTGAGFERMNLACPTDTLQAALTRISTALKRRQHK